MEIGILSLELLGGKSGKMILGETVLGLYCPGCGDFIQTADYARAAACMGKPEEVRAGLRFSRNLLRRDF